MKQKQKQLIGIVRNNIEGAIFLYFREGIYRHDCNLDETTDEDVINHYNKYGDILERDIKIKNAVNKLRSI
jgi:hypothetical protein